MIFIYMLPNAYSRPNGWTEWAKIKKKKFQGNAGPSASN